MKSKIMLILAMAILLSQMALAADQDSSCENCETEINNLGIKISELLQDIESLNSSLINITAERDFYKNISEYYQELYESKEINLTNKELINIYHTLNILNQNITEFNTRIDKLENKLTIFSLEIGLSIIALSALSVTFIEFFLRWRRRKRSGTQ